MPESIDVKLRIGELYCKAGQNEAAIKSLSGVEVKSNSDQARFDLVNGWAKRQMGQLDEAERSLEPEQVPDPPDDR